MTQEEIKEIERDLAGYRPSTIFTTTTPVETESTEDVIIISKSFGPIADLDKYISDFEQWLSTKSYAETVTYSNEKSEDDIVTTTISVAA